MIRHGILGGTFNPIHFGHLQAALDVAEQFELEQVHMMPVNIPSHRDAPNVSPAERSNMVELAIHNEAKLQLNSMEINRGGETRTIDTLRELKQQHPAIAWHFILGYDSFASFDSWHEWQTILQLCHLIVVPRPGYIEEFVMPEWSLPYQHKQQNTCQTDAGTILLAQSSRFAISATEIRQRLNTKRSINYMCPQAVVDFIHSKKLYQ